MYCIKLDRRVKKIDCRRCTHNGYEKLQNCQDMNLKTNLYPTHKKAEENNIRAFERYRNRRIERI